MSDSRAERIMGRPAMNENAGSTGSSDGFFARVSAYAATALRYWEPRRIIYNAVLACVVALEYVLALPASRARLTVDAVLALFMLAVLANIAYCAAYGADLFVQFAGLDRPWRRGRLVLLIVGTAFAAAITHFMMSGFLEP
jgi:hypothetical protein